MSHQQVDDKVLDEDYREIVTLLSATHSLQLQLAGARAQTKGLQQVTRDQSSWYVYCIQLHSMDNNSITHLKCIHSRVYCVY